MLIVLVMYACRELNCCDAVLLRLAGGSLSNKGRVELCISGQWKTVCDNSWSSNETRVVCRQLGYAYLGNKTSVRFKTSKGTNIPYVRVLIKRV